MEGNSEIKAEEESISDSESNEVVNLVSSYGYSDLRALGSLMQNDSELVYERRYNFKKYHNCFVGSEAVSWLVEKKISPDREAAVELGNLMLKEGILHHVTHEHAFKDEKLFYRFILSAYADHDEVVELQKIVQEKNNEVFELSHRVATLETNIAKLDETMRIGIIVATLLIFTLELLPLWIALGVTVVCIFPAGHLFISENAFLNGKSQHHDAVSKAIKTETGNVENPVSNIRIEQKDKFPVSTEEVIEMKKQLREVIGDQVSLFEDEYLREVMKQPDSKKPSQRRSFEYSKAKFKRIIEKRASVIDSFNDKMSSSEFYETDTVKSGSLYWYGYDARGIPILWVRAKLKKWSQLNIENEVRYHMEILDAGINLMPPEVTSFHIISDASGLGWKETNISLMKELLNLLMRVYPDRLESLHAGPVNPALKGLANILLRIMPARVGGKINLMSEKPFYHLTMEHQLLSSDKIPDFFGGPFSHNFEEVGEFSFEKMIQRQTLLLQEYMEGKKTQEMKKINHFL